MGVAGRLPLAASEGAEWLRDRLGEPALGVVLGSGFSPLAEALGAGPPVSPEAIPGYPAGGDGVAAAQLPGGRLWVFQARFHLYEGLAPEHVILPVALLAAAGARGVLFTLAAGGLRETDRPGSFALVVDHLNLTGVDPTRAPGTAKGAPTFVDLQQAYDPRIRDAWRGAARSCRLPLRDGVLAAVVGPAYETPAEVRMLRVLGGDLASMSTVPEVIAARYFGLRVAALACIANRGAGMEPDRPIRHEAVVRTVGAAVEAASDFLTRGVEAMLGAL